MKKRSLKFTVSSRLQVHDVAKLPARRTPDLVEHTDEVLTELGFAANEVERLRADGAIPRAQHLEAAGTSHQVRNQ